MSEFSHLDREGAARMVDVGEKAVVRRTATAAGRVRMSTQTIELLRERALPKGDALNTARIAGVMAAKRTPDLIPLCHQLTIGSVYVNFHLDDDFIEVESQVETVDRTGVEMEALLSCSVAALTIYDMCKSTDRAMTIGEVALWEKTGGRSGIWRREPDTNGSGRSAF